MSPISPGARRLAATASFLLAGAAPASLFAQQQPAVQPASQPASQPVAQPAMAAMPAMSSAGLRKELVDQIEGAEKKLIALAEAMPAAKYSWRPAKGVRSVSELFVHVASANYMLPPIAGVAASPSAPPQNAEKTVTTKARIVEMLKGSFAYARQAVMDVPDDQLDATVDLFGSPSTKRGVLVGEATHVHEHLGQAIAYARMNGVVPPWSRSRAAAGAP